MERLWLDSNGLTSSSFSLITDIVISCKVKILWIDGNDDIVGENEDFDSVLSDPSSVLEVLHMSDINLSSKVAIKLFSTLPKKSNLKKLWVTSNEISDEATQSIATAVKSNTTLAELNFGFNPISGESAKFILNALQYNDSLSKLGLPEYSEEIIMDIKSQLEMIHEKRRSRGCHLKLDISFW